MPDTGERDYIEVSPENMAEWYMHLVHIASYEYAARFAKGKKVLDYGCGSGYGSKILAETAAHVTAADLSEEAIHYARQHHSRPNLDFFSLSEFSGSGYDVIVSFQVIEHVPDVAAYLQTLHSLLSPDGILLISTPNRNTRLYPFQKPWNIWHLTEYSPQSLHRRIEPWFLDIEIHYISSVPDLILPELSRTRKLRMIALPATLPVYPEWIRRRLLKWQSLSFEGFRHLKSALKKTKSGSSAQTFPFTASDITFDQTTEKSSDLMAVCKKPKNKKPEQ